ncbi:MAG: hypothetical protein ACLTBU_07005 [Zhenhengia sp.]|uniref:hypothetical protein n=1 Tax=Zhenhengia sp. TaxID=2944208 RepID=UPI0039959119
MMQKKSKLIGSAILTIVGVWGMIITLLSDVLIKWIVQWQLARTVGGNYFLLLYLQYVQA